MMRRQQDPEAKSFPGKRKNDDTNEGRIGSASSLSSSSNQVPFRKTGLQGTLAVQAKDDGILGSGTQSEPGDRHSKRLNTGEDGETRIRKAGDDHTQKGLAQESTADASKPPSKSSSRDDTSTDSDLKEEEAEDKASLLYTDNIMAAAAATNEILATSTVASSEEAAAASSEDNSSSSFAQLLLHHHQLMRHQDQQRQQQDVASFASAGFLDQTTAFALISELRLRVTQLQQRKMELQQEVGTLKLLVSELVNRLMSSPQHQHHQQQPQEQHQQQQQERQETSSANRHQRPELFQELYPGAMPRTSNANLMAAAPAVLAQGVGAVSSSASMGAPTLYAAQYRQQQEAALANAAASASSGLLRQFLNSGQFPTQWQLPEASQSAAQQQSLWSPLLLQHVLAPSGAARESPTRATATRLPSHLLHQMQEQQQHSEQNPDKSDRRKNPAARR